MIIPGGVQVGGFIAPTDSADEYPVIDPIYGIDGYRSVADNTARDAITTLRRREGMMVYTQDTDKFWYLKDGITNSDWVEFTGSGAETDPVFTAWLAVPPNISIFTNDVPYLTAETDPVFTAWDKSHGDLTDLGVDDHTQYALLLGRSGGQTLIGGTGSGDDLTLKTTSHGTKGSYILSDLTDTGLVKTTAGVLSVDTSAYLTAEADTLDSVYTRGQTIVMDSGAILLDSDGSCNIFNSDVDIALGLGVKSLQDFLYQLNIATANADAYTGITTRGVLDYTTPASGISTVTHTWLDLDVTKSGVGAGLMSVTQNIFDVDVASTIALGNFINFKASTTPKFTVGLTGNVYAAGTLEVDGQTTLAALTGVLRADTGVVSVDSDVTDIVSAASDTLAGKIEIAVQSEMETGTATTLAVVPGRQHFHPGHPKCWLEAGVTGNILGSYNITSLTDTGTGVVTITIATDFSSTGYACVAQVQATGTTWAVANARECHIRSETQAAGSVALDCIDNTTTTNLVKDPTTWHMIACGDQA